MVFKNLQPDITISPFVLGLFKTIKDNTKLSFPSLFACYFMYLICYFFECLNHFVHFSKVS